MALISIAIINVLLFFFGETAAADVTTRRVGGANDGRPVNQRYEWSLDYTFRDGNGLIHSGHNTRRGSDISVKTDSRVYYFPFAPFINTLESDAEPNLSQLLYIGIGTFLLIVMNRKIKRVKQKPRGKHRESEISDYDDSVEESFHYDDGESKE